jgi:UDP:flavonoid glycosyltransferase YjiC (YdhE family)
MAVSDLRGTAALLEQERFTLIQAPLLQSSAARRAAPINYADMLLYVGYSDASGLTGALQGWLGLFELVQPVMMIYNHAPTALLAARVAGLPVMLIGTGFEIPPGTPSVLPSFRPWQDVPHSVLHGAEAHVLAQINHWLSRQGHAPLVRLTDLFQSSELQLTTFAELDPFGPRPASCQYIGPVFALPTMPTIEWKSTSQHRIFAYLRSSIPGVESLLTTLQQRKAEVVCVMPDMPNDWPARFDKLRFIAHPVNLSELLAHADVAVTYGAGTIAAALLAGVPVLLIPQVIEQYLSGLSLEKLGAGLMLREQRTPERCSELLNTLLTDTQYVKAAVRFKTQYPTFNSVDVGQQQFKQVVTLVDAESAKASVL